MKLPIDTTGLVCFASGPPRAVLDFETKSPKVEDGQPLHAVPITVVGDGDRAIIEVKVAGTPKALEPGTLVKVTGLVALPWTNGNKSGTSFRAARVEAVTTNRS